MADPDGSLRARLGAWWGAGLRAVDARAATARALRSDGTVLVCGPQRVVLGGRRIVVAGWGKAAAAMAAGVRDALGDRVDGGVVVVKDGHGLPIPGVAVLEASHPIPDARGAAAAARIGALVDGLGATDLLLALSSGGGSALLADPAPPWTLETLEAETARLLASGAEIGEINAWRAAHATLKGGRLGRRAAPAEVLTLVLSDVPGHPERVASGPTAGSGPLVEVAALDDAVDAAIAAARADGWPVTRLPRLAGEARALGEALADEIRGAVGPRVWIGGGEPTVTLGPAPGKGGRCQELALAAALGLGGLDGVALIAAGTDGTDGPTDAAGAVVDGTTAGRPGARDALDRHDAYPWLSAAGALWVTGPTRTNVGDLVIAALAAAPTDASPTRSSVG